MRLNLKPVILCGGAGTRLWPLSRELYPKQLLALIGEDTLLQDTVRRIPLKSGDAPILICNENHRFMVAEQLRAIDCQGAEILLEPVARNTAPAVALAAEYTLSRKDDAILVVLPSDHVIPDGPAFDAALASAIELAEDGYMVTFGVKPSRAETAYGYIKAGAALPQGFEVANFVEKPDQKTAEDYVAAGDFYWNSGMFVFKASRFLEELETFRPDILQAIRASISDIEVDRDFLRMNEATFAGCPAESIDYAVMEKTSRAAMVPLDAGWSDIGSWDSLWQASSKDDDGNALRGDVIVENVQGSYIRSEHRLVSAVGVSDLVIVETADAVMVSSQKDAQSVKQIVANLASCEREERLTHRKVQRPWGSYENLDTGHNFKVKRIIVKPGESLSLQMHHQRAEHWIVVTGTALVTRDNENFIVNQNESTFIPLGAKHRLTNEGDEPLEIIEVQSGDYLGEDDIVRFEDVYGRTTKD